METVRICFALARVKFLQPWFRFRAGDVADIRAYRLPDLLAMGLAETTELPATTDGEQGEVEASPEQAQRYEKANRARRV